MQEFVRKILIRHGIDVEEAEIAAFGLYNMILFLMGIIVAVIISIIMGEIGGIFLFLLFFIPLRTFAGGFHTKHLVSCGILSSIVIISVGEYYKHCIILNRALAIGIIFVSVAIHIFFSPQDCKSKRLLPKEKERYRYIIFLICAIYILVFSCAFILRREEIINSIILSLVSSSISVLIALCNNKICVTINNN